MGDRAHVHITIGGSLPREHLGEFAMCVADYDLRTEWDGEPFDPAKLIDGQPLELFGMELNGGAVNDVDDFCVEHGLPFHRWSGGCPGAFLPEIVVFDGHGSLRDYTASDDGEVLFTPLEIKAYARMRDLRRAIARAEIAVPPFVLV